MLRPDGQLRPSNDHDRITNRTLAVAVVIVASLIVLAPEAEATVTSLVTSGVLTVTSDDDADRITVGCSASGSLRVNGAQPDSGSVVCSVITSIVVNAGGGADLIFLQRVTEVSFTAIQQVSVEAGDGNDEVLASGVLDSVSVGAGRDYVEASMIQGDTVDGGDGSDTLRTDVESDVIVSNEALTFPAGAVPLTSVETVWIDATDGPETIDAHLYTGSLIVSSGGGDDRVIGGSGQNDVNSGAGDDEVTGGPASDFISAGDGDDTISGGTGGNQLKAGEGNDVVDGGPDGDSIVTGDGNDVARGHGGGDLFASAPGRDQLMGGAGNDNFSLFTPESVGSGTSFVGGSGKDSLKAQNLGRRTTLSDSTIESVIGDAQIRSIELTLLYASESETRPLRIDAHGFSGEVGIVGGYNDDLIIGGLGNDDLFGYQGDDTILGGPGNDRLDGDEGSDRCDGGPDRDRLVHCETRQN